MEIIMTKAMLASAALLFSFAVNAATVDGLLSYSEYTSNTINSGAQHWNTFGSDSTPDEYSDASGGSKYDIRYMGTTVEDGKFKFGILGGDILSGNQTAISNGHGLFLSDLAIGINPSTNPTLDSSDFNYAIRLLSTDSQTGKAQFELVEGGSWVGRNIYNRTDGKHTTETFEMIGGNVIGAFEGAWSSSTTQRNVLEGEFDLSWLSAFDASQGGQIGTYLTMTCVNDEASVYMDVDAVSQVPVPAAAFLFAPALIGFMGLRRKAKKA
jgi:hypothetical protein